MAKKGRQRANGEGTIRKLRDGRYQWRVMVGYKDDGKPLCPSGTTKGAGEEGRQEALAAIRAAREGYAAPSVAFTGKTKLAEFADYWYADLKGKVEPSTYDGYQYTLEHIKTCWGNKQISKLTTEDIERGLENLTVSFGYKQKIKTMLGQIYRKAEARDVIKRGMSPTIVIDKLRRTDKTKSTKDAYTVQDVTKLIAAMPDNRIGHAIRVLLACGMRVQELLALTVADIEPDGSVIEVTKALQTVGGKSQYGPPKSDAGERRIYVPEFAQKSAKWLRDHPATKDYPGIKLADNVKPDALFLGTRFCLQWPQRKLDGTPPLRQQLMTVNTFRKNYKNVTGGLDIPELTPHCCRHTYTTLHIVKLRTDPKVLQAQNGQSDMNTTLGYTHAPDDEQQAAAKAFNALIAGKKKKRYKLAKGY